MQCKKSSDNFEARIHLVPAEFAVEGAREHLVVIVVVLFDAPRLGHAAAVPLS